MMFARAETWTIRDIGAGFGDWVGIDRLDLWREWAVATGTSPAAFVNSIDAKFLDSPQADLSVSPATGDPRRIIRASDP